MITYSHDVYCDNRFMVSIEGHAGYAAEGADIVCAAASMLAFTLVEAIKNLDKKGMLESFYRSVYKGSIQLDFTVKEGSKECAEAVIESLACGFALLSDNYPDYVEVEY